MNKPENNNDLLLTAVDRAIETEHAKEEARGYLGMSAIGDECSRKLWYGFRWVNRSEFKADTIKKFDDGHLGEDVQADRLRMVPGVKLDIVDPSTGKQWAYSDLGGHFKGHADGKLKTSLLRTNFNSDKQIIWEHKQTEIKNQNVLAKLTEKDMSTALKKWDKKYYSQALMYMYYSGLADHYLTCASPGGRHSISVCTKENVESATKLIDKASSIIVTDTPPDRIADSPAYYQCKHFCSHSDICHDIRVPDVNCRTCLHSEPIIDDSNDAKWNCAYFDRSPIPLTVQKTGCDCHLFNPYMLKNWADPRSIKGDGEKIESIVYMNTETGKYFTNGPDHFSSLAIRQKDSPALLDDKKLLGGKS